LHELGLMDDLVCRVESELAGQCALVVRLEVGRLAGVLPDALRFCFDVCARGTRLEGATLEIIETAADELRLKEVEVV
jgi:hydrogenase nickel incorporation protein HypA/HybF